MLLQNTITNIKELTEDCLNTLEQLKERLLQEEKKFPEGRLRVSKRKSTYQYYLITEKNNRLGKYLSKKNVPLITQLARKTYYKKLILVLENEINSFNSILTNSNPDRIFHVYENLNEGLKPFVSNIIKSDELYAAEWEKVNYVKKSFKETEPQHITSFGLRVRSKSEILIAEALNRNHIPFRYEFPVKIKKYDTVYPDFYCLNLRTHEEVIWEHFGLMDNQEYADKAIKKIEGYMENGFSFKKNLCITLESTNNPLTLKQVNRVIKQYMA